LVVSSFNDRPGKLFDGIEHIRLSIILLSKCPSSARSVHSSSYLKWFTETRDTLFQTLSYSGVNSLIRDNDIPKCGFDLESKILEKLPVTKRGLSFYEASTGEARLYYTRKLSYFVQILDFVPNITDGEGVERPPSELKVVKLPSREMVDAYLCALNSTLFYWLLTVWSDCRNLNKREVYGIPFDPECAANETKTRLSQLADSLMADFAAKSNVLDVNYKSWGKMSIQCIYPKHSKPIIDEIDKVLAQHYGFTEEELDYIINYDIKYRMGKDLQEDGE